MKNISRHPEKLLALVIVCCLLITTAWPTSTFSEDISGHWAASDINFLREEGIIQGDENGNINPDSNITRAEFVAIINRAFGFTEKGASNFPDVKPGAWYYDNFAIAKNEGYILGDNYGNANPDTPIIRAEVAVIFGRVLGLEAKSATSSFADNTSFPGWSIGSIIALTENGLINGYPDNTFRAADNIKRAEAFTILSKIIRLEMITKAEEIGESETAQAGPDSGNVGGSGGGGGGGGGSNGGTVPRTPAAPTAAELSIALAPGDELCSTRITFSGTKATNADISKYEFLIAPSIGASAIWTPITSADLLTGKEVVVTSVLHNIYLRLKASGSTPAGTATAGKQLTKDSVNLSLNPTPQLWIDYDAETINVPGWYEFGFGDYDYTKVIYDGVTNQPVPFLPGTSVYIRNHSTTDLPFKDAYFDCPAPNSPAPPTASSGILTPGSVTGTINVKLSPLLEFKEVLPSADAYATGSNVIVDWTPGDEETGINIPAVEGYKIFYRAAAANPSQHWSEDLNDWVLDFGTYKSIPSLIPRVIQASDITPGSGNDVWINPFDDVGEGDWYYRYVAYVNGNRLMDGTSVNMFSPNLTTSRGMVAAFLYNIEGRPDVTNLINPFSDVAMGHPYVDAIKWAAHNQIMNGYNSVSFGPDDICPREFLVVMFYRHAMRKGLDVSATADLSGFTDFDAISEWTLEAMQWAVAKGIIVGAPDSTIRPQGTFTRAEFATMICRFVEAPV